MDRRLKITALIALFVLLIGSVILLAESGSAALVCNATAAASCAGTKVLYAKNDTAGYHNAHAELTTVASYPWAVCCNASADSQTVGTSCSGGGAAFLKLSATTNAHVQIALYTNYSNSACLSVTNKQVVCDAFPTSCPGNQTCVASINSSESWSGNLTNAHVDANCAVYPTKICCGYGTNASIMNTSRIAPSSPNTLDTLQGYCNATGGASVQYFYKWFNNSVFFSQGNTSAQTPGLEINVANISNVNLSLGHNWTLECTAWNGVLNSTPLNSTPVTIAQGCANITTPRANITLTQNLFINSSTCFNVWANNVTINCGGFNITGNNTANTYGVYSNSTNTTIQGCTIKNFDNLVYFNNARYGTIRNSTFTLNTSSTLSYMVYFSSSTNMTFFNNTVNGSGAGSGTGYGILAAPCNDCSFSNNNVTVGNWNNQLALGVSGNKLSITSNILNASAGSTGTGLSLSSTTTYATVAFNTVDSIVYSLQTNNLQNSIIANNTFTTSGAWPTQIASSTGNTFWNNTFMSSSAGARSIYMYSTSTDNNITLGSFLTYIGAGFASGSSRNIIRNVTINASNTGIYFYDAASVNNSFYWNNFTGSGAWVNNINETNTFNTSLGGHAQGNFYPSITSYKVYDTDGDNWGDSGGQYPFNNVTVTSMWTGPGADYGPATSKAHVIANISLMIPTNGNLTVHSRTPTFQWNATNPDGEILNFSINISSSTSPSCPNYNYTTTNNVTNITITTNLCVSTDGGGGTYYNWTVRGCDLLNCTSWAGKYNFTIEPYVDINITNKSMNFGTLGLGQSKDTTAGNPGPFVLQNNGNVVADLVNISANQSLWQSVGLGNKYFQAKANISTGGSFNTSGSLMTYFNLTSSNSTIVRQLNWSNPNNTAAIDINVQVPSAEPEGSKKSYLIFSWVQTP